MMIQGIEQRGYNGNDLYRNGVHLCSVVGRHEPSKSDARKAHDDLQECPGMTWAQIGKDIFARINHDQCIEYFVIKTYPAEPSKCKNC